MKRMKEMRTWKRTAGCFLAAVMTAGLLMGCSTQGGGAAQAETNQEAVSYTHLDVYKRQRHTGNGSQ